MLGKRTCQIGIVPDTPTHAWIGVLIRRGEGDKGIVIPPDEARTLALEIEDDDPEVAVQLRELADGVEGIFKGVVKGKAFLALRGASIVRPKITGPHALRDWVQRWRRKFQDAYKSALAAGWHRAVVMVAHPETESLDDPPARIRNFDPGAANGLLTKVKLKPDVQDTPPDGFYVIATRGEGRFQGTFVGILPAAGDKRPTLPEDN
jgi:hypothetical protein